MSAVTASIPGYFFPAAIALFLGVCVARAVWESHRRSRARRAFLRRRHIEEMAAARERAERSAG